LKVTIVLKAKAKLNIYFALVTTLIAGVALTYRAALCQSTGQETFKTPQAAADALVQAAKVHDRSTVLGVLGTGGEQVVSSGDPEEDAQQRAVFLEKYQQMHRFVPDGKHTEIMYIGVENWPVPIPLVKGKSGWYFDTRGAEEEILARRVGENELSAINVCLATVAAQNEYKAQLHDGEATHQYARRFLSSEGKHDGLYWKADGPERKSPLGPRLALASYTNEQTHQAGQPKPYHGYFYKILTAQGKNAPGGATSYMVDGKLSKGFAVAAYPARYRLSGVTTFLVNQDGIVYQKDLGPQTEKIASSMTTYNPDSSWIRAN
jgi:Protein of unknown function (DUF2950)